MSGMTKGNIKLVSERYDNINGEIAENGTLRFFHKEHLEYLYSKIKYTKPEVILYIPYIKYDDKVFVYTKIPDCKITEDNINVAVMTGLIYVLEANTMRVLENCASTCCRVEY